LATQKSHTPPPEGDAVRAYKNSHANKSQKMLASTVQFSTYDQTPITRPHQPRPTLKWNSGMRYRPALTQEQRPPPNTPQGPGRSALSGPNSVPTTTTPTRLPSTHTPKGTQY